MSSTPAGRSVRTGTPVPAQLVGIPDGKRVVLDRPIVLLGRDSECDVQFDSRKISRRHCCIAQVGDRLVVRDLGSTNGIRVNSVRVSEGYLKDGDELAVGSLRFQVRWNNGTEAPRQALEMKITPPPTGAVGSSVEDAALEASDEPIPLGSLPARGRVIPGPSTPPVDRPPSPLPSTPPAQPIDEGIPEEARLIPVSDELPALSPRKRPRT